MKTPEEWIEYCNESKLFRDDHLTTASTSDIRAIQLDAWRQGMTDAAEIVVKYAVDLGRTPVGGVRHLIEDGRGYEDEVRKTYRQAILAARDAKGTTEQTQRKET